MERMTRALLILLFLLCVGNAYADGTLIAGWGCNDNAASTDVEDVSGNGHTATASANTSVLHDTGIIGSGSFDLDHTYTFIVADHNDFTFGNGSDDSAFSISAWVNIAASSNYAYIAAKFNTSNMEWQLMSTSAEKISFNIFDNSRSSYRGQTTDDVLSNGEHHIVVTYDGSEASSGVTIYVDNVAVDVSVSESGTYTAMENKSGPLCLGCRYISGSPQASTIYNSNVDAIYIYSGVLSAAQITALYEATDDAAEGGGSARRLILN